MCNCKDPVLNLEYTSELKKVDIEILKKEYNFFIKKYEHNRNIHILFDVWLTARGIINA